MPLISLDDFDVGLWLISGREAVAPNALRQATGINPVHSKSVRSRYGNALALVEQNYAGTVEAIFTFQSIIMAQDTTGILWAGAVNIGTGFTAGKITFIKAPPHFGSNAYLFAVGGGRQVKIDQNFNVTNWGIPTAADGLVANVQSPAPVTVDIDDFDSLTGIVALPNTTLSLDTTDNVDGVASLQAVVTALQNGGFIKNAYVKVATTSASISQSGTTVTVTTASTIPAAFMVGMSITLSGYTIESGSIVPTGTITSASGTTIIYTAGSSATGTAKGGIAWALLANLDPSGSSDSDNFILYFQISQPEYLKALLIEFDLGTGFTSNYYTASVTTANLVATPTVSAPTDITGMDQAASMMLGRSFTSISPAATTQMGQEFIAQQKNYLVNTFGKATTRAQFSPSSGGQVALQSLSNAIVPADNQWWQILLPRGNFKRIGKNGALGWNTVSGYRIQFRDRHSTDAVTMHFDSFGFQGGVGMLGDYQYVYTWENSISGSYGNPNPTPVSVLAVNRTGIVLNLAGIPAPPDAQIDTLVLWRTMGNGGTFYRLANINTQEGVPNLIIDNVSDFFGFGVPIADWQTSHTYAANATILPTVGNESGYVFTTAGGGTSGATEPSQWPQVSHSSITDGSVTWVNTGTINGTLSLEPLLQVNVQPAATITQAIYFNGTMFLCGDTAVGARGRIYYSSPGFAEGIAGYTDITNDDDPTQAFAVYGNQLYVFTEKAMWLVVDISVNAALPAFTVQLVQNAPGTTSPYSVVATPNALIYQGTDGGLYGFDGYYAEAVGPQLLTIFRGETVEGYAPIGTILAATFGRDEYWFTDGSHGTYAMNVMPSSIPGAVKAVIFRQHGVAANSLYYAPELGEVLAGWGGAHTYILEAEEQFLDNGAPIPFAVQTRAAYSGDKYTFRPARILIDCNPSGDTLTVTALVDNEVQLLGTLFGTARAKFEFPMTKPCSLLSVRITGNLANAGFVEVFRVAFDMNEAGTTDVNAKS